MELTSELLTVVYVDVVKHVLVHHVSLLGKWSGFLVKFVKDVCPIKYFMKTL